MNATIIHRARENMRHYVGDRATPAVVAIDGVEWSSPYPTNSGEAQTYNEDAERICERVRAK